MERILGYIGSNVVDWWSLIWSMEKLRFQSEQVENVIFNIGCVWLPIQQPSTIDTQFQSLKLLLSSGSRMVNILVFSIVGS